MTCTKQVTAHESGGIDWSQLNWNTSGGIVSLCTLTINGVDVPNATPTACGQTATLPVTCATFVPGLASADNNVSGTMNYTGAGPVNCRMRLILNQPFAGVQQLNNLRVTLNAVILTNHDILPPQAPGAQNFDFTITGPGAIEVSFRYIFGDNPQPTNDFVIALLNL